MKHTVKAGETLSKIALKYGTTIFAIRDANRNLIKDVNKINVGWVLTIPATNGKNYESIGRQFEICLNDIKNLSSYKKLVSML